MISSVAEISIQVIANLNILVNEAMDGPLMLLTMPSTAQEHITLTSLMPSILHTARALVGTVSPSAVWYTSWQKEVSTLGRGHPDARGGLARQPCNGRRWRRGPST